MMIFVGVALGLIVVGICMFFFNYYTRINFYKQVEANRLINLKRKLDEVHDEIERDNSGLSLDELLKRQR